MTDQDENSLIAQRRAKLDALRSTGNAFPNDFRRNSVAGELHAEYDDIVHVYDLTPKKAGENN